MDYARENDVDMALYAAYLERHWTSRRADELKNMVLEMDA